MDGVLRAPWAAVCHHLKAGGTSAWNNSCKLLFGSWNAMANWRLVPHMAETPESRCSRAQHSQVLPVNGEWPRMPSCRVDTVKDKAATGEAGQRMLKEGSASLDVASTGNVGNPRA